MDNRNGKEDVYVFDLTTGIERRLTTDPASQRQPAIDANFKFTK
jgi:hypothetical protein